MLTVKRLVGIQVASLALGVLSLLPLTPVQAHDMEGHAAAERSHGHDPMAMTRFFDRAAARLELRASQMPAWENLVSAMREMHPAPHPGEHPESPTAVELTRAMADRSADHATRLARLADATAALAAVLDPNQVKVLDQLARQMAQHHRRARHGAMHGGAGHEKSHGDHGQGAPRGGDGDAPAHDH